MKSIRRNMLVHYGVIALLTCALAVLALAGCSSSSATSPTSASSTSASSTASYRTLDQIKSAGTIKVGVYGDGSVQQAFDEAVAARIASDLGVKCETVPLKTDERIAALQKGSVDLLVANLSVTDERAKQVDFGTPYVGAMTAILTSTNNMITSESQIADGRKIGVLKGTVAETTLKSRYPSVNLVEIDSYDAITNGTVDAIADDGGQLIVWMDSHAGYYVGVNFPSDYLDIAPAVAKDNSTLLDAVNSEVATLMQEKFFSDTFNKVNPAADVSAPLTFKDTHADTLSPNDSIALNDGTYTSSDGQLTMVIKGGKQDVTIDASPLAEDVFHADMDEVITKATK